MGKVSQAERVRLEVGRPREVRLRSVLKQVVGAQHPREAGVRSFAAEWLREGLGERHVRLHPIESTARF